MYMWMPSFTHFNKSLVRTRSILSRKIFNYWTALPKIVHTILKLLVRAPAADQVQTKELVNGVAPKSTLKFLARSQVIFFSACLWAYITRKIVISSALTGRWCHVYVGVFSYHELLLFGVIYWKGPHNRCAIHCELLKANFTTWCILI